MTLVGGLIIVIGACLPAAGPPATGPLRVHPTDLRYFADGYRPSPAG